MRARLGSVCLGMLVAATLHAGAACGEVVAAVASESSHGQAYTFRLAEGCFAALPAHVVAADAGDLLAPMLRSRTGREGEGTRPRRPDANLDLVFVNVQGGLSQPCGSAENLGPDNLDYTLSGETRFTLRVARTRSAVQQIPLRLSRVNRTYAWFAAPAGQQIDEITRSMSGGLVLVDETPVAMLLSVSNEDGLAQALRFDVIKRLARETLVQAPAASAPAGAARFRVSSWHGESTDPSRPPSAVMSGGVWRARPVARRVELVLQPAAPVKIARVLVARAAQPDEAPELLSIWSSGRVGADWVLLRTCTARGGSDGALFDCSVAPVEVAALRLDFSRRGDAAQLSIGAVEVR